MPGKAGRKRGQPGITQGKRSELKAAYLQTGSVTAAAKLVGCTIGTAYKYRRSDAWDDLFALKEKTTLGILAKREALKVHKAEGLWDGIVDTLGKVKVALDSLVTPDRIARLESQEMEPKDVVAMLKALTQAAQMMDTIERRNSGLGDKPPSQSVVSIILRQYGDAQRLPKPIEVQSELITEQEEEGHEGTDNE